MENRNSQVFNLKEQVLYYDFMEGVLLARRAGDRKNQWIKKIHEPGSLLGVTEDDERLYLSFAESEKNGQFTVLERNTGKTLWVIPGRSFLNQLYGEYIFLIFSDASDIFYLLKVDKKNGSKIWHHPVHEGLYEYIIKRDSISLKYNDGPGENISMETGEIIRTL